MMTQDTQVNMSDRYSVQLAVYDLTNGMASQLGPALLGIQLEGVWHTGVIAYGKEHFFGGGIISVPHEEFLSSYHLRPVETLELGETEVPEELFNEFLREISPRYTGVTYDLVTHNCNNFSNEAVTFLLGTGIPSHILELPERVFSSPMGILLRPMIEQMQGGMRTAIPGFQAQTYEGSAHFINSPPPLVPSSQAIAQPQQEMHLPNAWLAAAPPQTRSPETMIQARSGPLPSPADISPRHSTSRQPALESTSAKTIRSSNVALESTTRPGDTLLMEDKAFISFSEHEEIVRTVDKLRFLRMDFAPKSEDGRGTGLTPEDDLLLQAAKDAFSSPDKLIPSGLSDLMASMLRSASSKQGEAYVLSLLRALSSRPDFVAPNVVDTLLDRTTRPETFRSKVSPTIAWSCLSNICTHDAGRKIILQPGRVMRGVDAAMACIQDSQVSLRQVGSAFLANLAMGITPDDAVDGELPELVVQMLCGSLAAIDAERDSTSALRRLLCAGRLLRHCAAGVNLARSLGLFESVSQAGSLHGGKVRDLANEINRL